MTQTTKPRKAKRKLSEVSFEHEGAHIALVSKQQGGPANGAGYTLIMKALETPSQEFVQKMQQVRVTMELPEFLRKFFGLYYEDSAVLAAMLGYVAPKESTDVVSSYDDYIQSKLDSFEILKSLHESEVKSTELAKLPEDQILSVLQDQEKIEKAFAEYEESVSKGQSLSGEGSLSDEGETTTVVKANVKSQKVKPSKVINKGKNMDELVEVQKALDEQKVALQKAMETIAQFEAKEKESIQKARLAKVTAAVKNAEQAAVIFKALSLLEDETEFEAVVSTLAEMQVAVEKSALFVEQGANVEVEEVPQESAVARILKANLQK